MSIWFYLFLGFFCFSILLLIKIVFMKQEMKNIRKSLRSILKSDTNQLITLHYNDKDLKQFAIMLNESLKKLRALELEYKNGNQELQFSITNISHDLRTPLTAIRGYLDLFEYQHLTEKQIHYLKIIDQKVKDLTVLTEQLFDFSKNMDLPEKIQQDDVCLNDILEDSIVSFYSLFQEKCITPTIDICKKKIVRRLNENMLKRIFENIISNALKYGEKDFYVSMKENGMIEFSNHTDQIDSTSLEKLFHRYYTVRNVKKSNGIGLSIVKQFVSLCGGKMEAKYKDGILIIKLFF